jgi:hypothetical protein
MNYFNHAFLTLLDQILEAGRTVSRDIGGSDPERMAAPRYIFPSLEAQF